MKHNKIGRILALILVIAMLLGACAQLFAMIAYAAYNIDVNDDVNVVFSSGANWTYINNGGSSYDITFSFVDYNSNIPSELSGRTIVWTGRNEISLSTNWTASSSTQLTFEVEPTTVPQSDPVQRKVSVTLSNVKYGRSNMINAINIAPAVDGTVRGLSTTTTYCPTLNLDIPSNFFTRQSSGSSGGDDDVINLNPDIVIENVQVYDSDNKLIDKVTKDTAPFSVEIVYSDYGLVDADHDDIYQENLEVYATDFGGFVPRSGTRGTLTKISTISKVDAPRFRIKFSNLTYDGGSSTIAFRVQYDIAGDFLSATDSVRVYQATTEEDEDDDELPPPTPYIIVSQYSYGSDDIVAGNSFSLNLSYQNTSSDIALENIIMTVTTPEDLSIASASNTVYVANLGAGASLNHTVELQARPNAAVGSHSVQIDFAYQYVWDKERKDGKTTESIAVPITQIDRFELDPITEMSDWTQVGDQFYVTISFINRGKSPTYNITATARSNLDMLVINEHYGNLEAGKADSVDVTIIPNEGGDMVGEVAVQYEDENNNPKELTMPFTIYVDTPWDPSMDPDWNPDPGMEEWEEEEPRRNTASTVLYIIGGALIAFALAFYVMQRVKSKESDGFDEDF